MGNSGRFVWYELATADTEAAKAFYSSVLAWGTQNAQMEGSVYTLFTSAGTPVAGLVQLAEDAKRAGVAPQWIGYVRVGDVDAAAGLVKELGGTVHVPPVETGISRFSLISDPQMATLALIEVRESGPQRPSQPGAHGRAVWHELLTSNWESAFAFYKALLGWQKADADVTSRGTYQQFSADTEAIGGMLNKPEMLPFSLWVHYFIVADIGAAVRRAKNAGGKILYGPVAVQRGLQIAQCADAQGAIFGLIAKPIYVAVGCYSPRNPSDRPGGP